MSVGVGVLNLFEESAEDESELSWGYERAPEGMPGSLPGVTPLARDALRMKPTKRLYVDLVPI